jgi:hypothetical protein
MAVKITAGEAVLYDSVTGQAFGPVWSDYEDAEEFLKWALDSELPSVDELTYKDLNAAIAQFYADRAATGGAPLVRYARRGVASMTTGETATAAYDRAIESYVQDNGDWVPITVAEVIRSEVERILAEAE